MSGARADGWRWWEARRLRYNLALAIAGLTAYALATGLFAAFGAPPMRDWRTGLSTTLFLGVLYLLLMGAANVCFLAGVALESWLRPEDPDGFRRRAFALGFWGSIALPFAFPALMLAQLIGPGR